MVLTGEHGVVPVVPQQFGKADLVFRNLDVQFGRSSIVRIPTGNDADTARAATAYGQIRVIKTHTI